MEHISRAWYINNISRWAVFIFEYIDATDLETLVSISVNRQYGAACLLHVYQCVYAYLHDSTDPVGKTRNFLRRCVDYMGCAADEGEDLVEEEETQETVEESTMPPPQGPPPPDNADLPPTNPPALPQPPPPPPPSLPQHPPKPPPNVKLEPREKDEILDRVRNLRSWPLPEDFMPELPDVPRDEPVGPWHRATPPIVQNTFKRGSPSPVPTPYRTPHDSPIPQRPTFIKKESTPTPSPQPFMRTPIPQQPFSSFPRIPKQEPQDDDEMALLTGDLPPIPQHHIMPRRSLLNFSPGYGGFTHLPTEGEHNNDDDDELWQRLRAMQSPSMRDFTRPQPPTSRLPAFPTVPNTPSPTPDFDAQLNRLFKKPPPRRNSPIAPLWSTRNRPLAAHTPQNQFPHQQLLDRENEKFRRERDASAERYSAFRPIDPAPQEQIADDSITLLDGWHYIPATFYPTIFPGGATVRIDPKSGRIYYFDLQTGTSNWVPDHIVNHIRRIINNLPTQFSTQLRVPNALPLPPRGATPVPLNIVPDVDPLSIPLPKTPIPAADTPPPPVAQHPQNLPPIPPQVELQLPLIDTTIPPRTDSIRARIKRKQKSLIQPPIMRNSALDIVNPPPVPLHIGDIDTTARPSSTSILGEFAQARVDKEAAATATSKKKKKTAVIPPTTTTATKRKGRHLSPPPPPQLPTPTPAPPPAPEPVVSFPDDRLVIRNQNRQIVRSNAPLPLPPPQDRTLVQSVFTRYLSQRETLAITMDAPNNSWSSGSLRIDRRSERIVVLSRLNRQQLDELDVDNETRKVLKHQLEYKGSMAVEKRGRFDIEKVAANEAGIRKTLRPMGRQLAIEGSPGRPMTSLLSDSIISGQSTTPAITAPGVPALPWYDESSGLDTIRVDGGSNELIMASDLTGEREISQFPTSSVALEQLMPYKQQPMAAHNSALNSFPLSRSLATSSEGSNALRSFLQMAGNDERGIEDYSSIMQTMSDVSISGYIALMANHFLRDDTINTIMNRNVFDSETLAQIRLRWQITSFLTQDRSGDSTAGLLIRNKVDHLLEMSEDNLSGSDFFSAVNSEIIHLWSNVIASHDLIQMGRVDATAHQLVLLKQLIETDTFDKTELERFIFNIDSLFYSRAVVPILNILEESPYDLSRAFANRLERLDNAGLQPADIAVVANGNVVHIDNPEVIPPPDENLARSEKRIGKQTSFPNDITGFAAGGFLDSYMDQSPFTTGNVRVETRMRLADAVMQCYKIKGNIYGMAVEDCINTRVQLTPTQSISLASVVRIDQLDTLDPIERNKAIRDISLLLVVSAGTNTANIIRVQLNRNSDGAVVAATDDALFDRNMKKVAKAMANATNADDEERIRQLKSVHNPPHSRARDYYHFQGTRASRSIVSKKKLPEKMAELMFASSYFLDVKEKLKKRIKGSNFKRPYRPAFAVSNQGKHARNVSLMPTMVNESRRQALDAEEEDFAAEEEEEAQITPDDVETYHNLALDINGVDEGAPQALRAIDQRLLDISGKYMVENIMSSPNTNITAVQKLRTSELSRMSLIGSTVTLNGPGITTADRLSLILKYGGNDDPAMQFPESERAPKIPRMSAAATTRTAEQEEVEEPEEEIELPDIQNLQPLQEETDEQPQAEALQEEAEEDIRSSQSALMRTKNWSVEGSDPISEEVAKQFAIESSGTPRLVSGSMDNITSPPSRLGIVNFTRPPDFSHFSNIGRRTWGFDVQPIPPEGFQPLFLRIGDDNIYFLIDSKQNVPIQSAGAYLMKIFTGQRKVYLYSALTETWIRYFLIPTSNMKGLRHYSIYDGLSGSQLRLLAEGQIPFLYGLQTTENLGSVDTTNAVSQFTQPTPYDVLLHPEGEQLESPLDIGYLDLLPEFSKDTDLPESVRLEWDSNLGRMQVGAPRLRQNERRTNQLQNVRERLNAILQNRQHVPQPIQRHISIGQFRPSSRMPRQVHGTVRQQGTSGDTAAQDERIATQLAALPPIPTTFNVGNIQSWQAPAQIAPPTTSSSSSSSQQQPRTGSGILEGHRKHLNKNLFNSLRRNYINSDQIGGESLLSVLPIIHRFRESSVSRIYSNLPKPNTRSRGFKNRFLPDFGGLHIRKLMDNMSPKVPIYDSRPLASSHSELFYNKQYQNHFVGRLHGGRFGYGIDNDAIMHRLDNSHNQYRCATTDFLFPFHRVAFRTLLTRSV